MILMFIGGASASTAGGIRVSTFGVLVLAALAYVRGTDVIKVGTRVLSPETIQKAVAILMISAGVVVTGACLLMLTHPVAFEIALFEAVSAFATCGFTLGFTSQLTGYGRLIVALLMLFGKLGPLTIVVATTHSRRPAPLHYPEERVLVG